jgi:ankyrin repeat protein
VAVAYLLSQGADATIRDKQGKTPLMCCGSDLGVVKLLLQQMGGQGLNDIDEEGGTALHWAVWTHRMEVAKYLLVAGADPTVRDNEGRTPRAVAETYGGWSPEHCAEFMAVFDVVSTHAGYAYTVD